MGKPNISDHEINSKFMNPKQMMFARRRRAEKIGILGVHGRFWGKSGVRGRRGVGVVLSSAWRHKTFIRKILAP